MDPNCLALWWYSWKNFYEKIDFEKSADDKKHETLPSRLKLKDVHSIICIKMSRDIHTALKLISAHAPLITHMGFLSCRSGFVLWLLFFRQFYYHSNTFQLLIFKHGCNFIVICLHGNSMDPVQLASSETSWYRSTIFKKGKYFEKVINVHNVRIQFILSINSQRLPCEGRNWSCHNSWKLIKTFFPIQKDSLKYHLNVVYTSFFSRPFCLWYSQLMQIKSVDKTFQYCRVYIARKSSHLFNNIAQASRSRFIFLFFK